MAMHCARGKQFTLQAMCTEVESGRHWVGGRLQTSQQKTQAEVITESGGEREHREMVEMMRSPGHGRNGGMEKETQDSSPVSDLYPQG
jgi:hypothetical protein